MLSCGQLSAFTSGIKQCIFNGIFRVLPSYVYGHILSAPSRSSSFMDVDFADIKYMQTGEGGQLSAWQHIMARDEYVPILWWLMTEWPALGNAFDCGSAGLGEITLWGLDLRDDLRLTYTLITTNSNEWGWATSNDLSPTRPRLSHLPT